MGAMRIGIPEDYRNYLSLRGASVTGEAAADHQPLTARALAIGTFLSFFLADEVLEHFLTKTQSHSLNFFSIHSLARS